MFDEVKSRSLSSNHSSCPIHPNRSKSCTHSHTVTLPISKPIHSLGNGDSSLYLHSHHIRRPHTSHSLYQAPVSGSFYSTLPLGPSTTPQRYSSIANHSASVTQPTQRCCPPEAKEHSCSHSTETRHHHCHLSCRAHCQEVKNSNSSNSITTSHSCHCIHAEPTHRKNIAETSPRKKEKNNVASYQPPSSSPYTISIEPGKATISASAGDNNNQVETMQQRLERSASHNSISRIQNGVDNRTASVSDTSSSEEEREWSEEVEERIRAKELRKRQRMKDQNKDKRYSINGTVTADNLHGSSDLPFACPNCCHQYKDSIDSNKTNPRTPRVLHCGHTFCSKCLFRLLRPHRNAVECPCGCVDTPLNAEYGINGLPVNEELLQLIGERHNKKSRSFLNCSSHSQYPLTLWCRSCSIPVCFACTSPFGDTIQRDNVTLTTAVHVNHELQPLAEFVASSTDQQPILTQLQNLRNEISTENRRAADAIAAYNGRVSLLRDSSHQKIHEMNVTISNMLREKQSEIDATLQSLVAEKKISCEKTREHTALLLCKIDAYLYEYAQQMRNGSDDSATMIEERKHMEKALLLCKAKGLLHSWTPSSSHFSLDAFLVSDESSVLTSFRQAVSSLQLNSSPPSSPLLSITVTAEGNATMQWSSKDSNLVSEWNVEVMKRQRGWTLDEEVMGEEQGALQITSCKTQRKKYITTWDSCYVGQDMQHKCPLLPQYLYWFRVHARNKVGTSSWVYSRCIKRKVLFASYKSDMDRNGIIYYSGSQSRTIPFRNPVDLAADASNCDVELSITSLHPLSAPISALTSRLTTCVATLPLPHQHLTITFPRYTVLLSHYSLVSAHKVDTTRYSGNGYMQQDIRELKDMRLWKLWGRTDAAGMWREIASHERREGGQVSEQQGSKEDGETSNSLPTCTTYSIAKQGIEVRAFRSLRIEMRNGNEKKFEAMVLGGIEFYGIIVPD